MADPSGLDIAQAYRILRQAADNGAWMPYTPQGPPGPRPDVLQSLSAPQSTPPAVPPDLLRAFALQRPAGTPQKGLSQILPGEYPWGDQLADLAGLTGATIMAPTLPAALLGVAGYNLMQSPRVQQWSESLYGVPDILSQFALGVGAKGGEAGTQLGAAGVTRGTPWARAAGEGGRGGLSGVVPSEAAPYGEMVPSNRTDPLVVKLRNTDRAVNYRVAEAHRVLDQQNQIWTPRDFGIFDRNLIKDAMNGFPDVQQTTLPRRQPGPRVDLSHIDANYADPRNAALIVKQIQKGLPLGGDTFYPSLWPVKAELMSRGYPGSLFDNWIWGVAPASQANSIPMETAIGNLLREIHMKGLPLNDENVAAALRDYQQIFGKKPAMMGSHVAGVARVLEQGVTPYDLLTSGETDAYKLPTYAINSSGNFAHSATLDRHELRGHSLGSIYHPWFDYMQSLEGPAYGRAEAKFNELSKSLGLPTGTSQAARWMAGGELTGLRSPLGDRLDGLEKQVAYTRHEMGLPTDPKSMREAIIDLIIKGGKIAPWYSDDPIPEYRSLRSGR